MILRFVCPCLKLNILLENISIIADTAVNHILSVFCILFAVALISSIRVTCCHVQPKPQSELTFVGDGEGVSFTMREQF